MIQKGSVKPGDKVIVSEGLDNEFVATVLKITKQGNIRIDSDLTENTFDPSGFENNGRLFAICHMELYPYSKEAENVLKKNAAKKKALQTCHYITKTANKQELQELIANLQSWIDGIDEGILQEDTYVSKK